MPRARFVRRVRAFGSEEEEEEGDEEAGKKWKGIQLA